MSTYTCKLQRVNFSSDQFQDKGTVAKEKAVSLFKLFPWDEPFKGDREEDDPPIPKLIFNSEDERQLIIYVTSWEDATFAIEYANFRTNAYSDFLITSDSKDNGWTVKTMIEFFFENTIEAQLEMSATVPEQTQALKRDEKKIETAKGERSKRPDIKLDFRPKHFRVIGFYTFFWMGISILLVYLGIPIGVQLLLTLAWLPAIFLHITYYLKDSGVQVIIDPRKQILTYRKGPGEIKFGLNDIVTCKIIKVVTWTKSRSSWDNYSYVWFTLKDGANVTITCLLADPLAIVETLNCNFEIKKKVFPLLPMK